AEDARHVDQGISYPLPILRAQADELVSIWVDTNSAGMIEQIPQALTLDGDQRRTIGPWMVDAPNIEKPVLVDWSYRFDQIPSYSVIDVMEGRVPASKLQGKNLIVGADIDLLGDVWLASNGERMSGARVQILAAETLMKGQGAAINQ